MGLGNPFSSLCRSRPTLRELCGHLCLAGGLPVKASWAGSWKGDFKMTTFLLDDEPHLFITLPWKNGWTSPFPYLKSWLCWEYWSAGRRSGWSHGFARIPDYQPVGRHKEPPKPVVFMWCFTPFHPSEPYKLQGSLNYPFQGNQTWCQCM